jgi:hypothetical protein
VIEAADQIGHEAERDTALLPAPPRLGRALPIACGAAVIACAAWALLPLDSTAPLAREAVAADPLPPTVELALAPLDQSAFRAPLWVAPPPPPPPAAPVPPPPPLKLQLLAVLREGDTFKAALYDPDADTIIVAGPGDTVAGRRVEQVRAGDVTLKDNGLSRVLSLKPEGSTP